MVVLVSLLPPRAAVTVRVVMPKPGPHALPDEDEHEHDHEMGPAPISVAGKNDTPDDKGCELTNGPAIAVYGVLKQARGDCSIWSMAGFFIFFSFLDSPPPHPVWSSPSPLFLSPYSLRFRRVVGHAHLPVRAIARLATHKNRRATRTDLRRLLPLFLSVPPLSLASLGLVACPAYTQPDKPIDTICGARRPKGSCQPPRRCSTQTRII